MWHFPHIDLSRCGNRHVTVSPCPALLLIYVIQCLHLIYQLSRGPCNKFLRLPRQPVWVLILVLTLTVLWSKLNFSSFPFSSVKWRLWYELLWRLLGGWYVNSLKGTLCIMATQNVLVVVNEQTWEICDLRMNSPSQVLTAVTMEVSHLWEVSLPCETEKNQGKFEVWNTETSPPSFPPPHCPPEIQLFISVHYCYLFSF